MYQPKKYKKQDPQYIFDFITAHPFATFVLNGEQLLATHIPVLIEGEPEKFILYGHIANHNEMFSHLKDGKEALLIFQGAQGYISSSWYKEKNISTWDYSAVHINVKLKIQSEAELRTSLDKLIFHFEKTQESPLLYKDIPKDMLEDHIPQITGFWCEPMEIKAIAKLHQGYDKDDVKSVVNHLKTRENNSQLAEDIENEGKDEKS